MEMADKREAPNQWHRAKASNRSRPRAMGVPDMLHHAQLGALEAAPLADRLQLNWRSLPARKEAKLYTPSVTQGSHEGRSRISSFGKVPSEHASPSLEPLKSAGRRKLVQTISTNIATFEQSMSISELRRQRSRTNSLECLVFDSEYGSEDVLMRYVLHVIRTSCSVRRSEIPRGKRIQRKVRPEEDVLYLVPCEAPPCGFRNVYWLTFADEGTILRSDHTSSFEYFTLGCHGFTRFKGGQGIEFSDLANWVDEKRAFDHMTNMKGLERIQQMIFFFSWKRQAVQRRLRRVKERLTCTLFTCHPIAARLLMTVRDICREIEREAGMEYVQADSSYLLECLVCIHRDRARAAKIAIATKVQELCITIDGATRDISRYKEESCYAVTDEEAFSKSLWISSLRERMFTFLRLVDVHVAEAVYAHVAVVIRDLRDRICGQSVEEQSPGIITFSSSAVHTTERRECLCRNESVKIVSEGSSPGQHCQLVNFSVYTFESGTTGVLYPGLYVNLQDDVSFGGAVNSASISFAPTKVEVLEMVHTILSQYCAAMDRVPRVLMDKHFEHVLTPFVPSVRKDFSRSMLKPSHLVLKSYERELCEMRAALDMHYRRIGILQQEHLRCIRAIKVAERDSPVESTKTCATGNGEEKDQLPELPDLSTSAAAYELAQKTWNRFVQYADAAAPILQVGYLLLDQRSFVEKLRMHVSKRVAEMDDALPSIYQQFLTSLLEDVDGCIEKVTNIPTNLSEANVWLAQVTSMMTTHPFRQRLDIKIDNLARLRVIMKERGLVSLDSEIQNAIHKLELMWESVIETLLMCLSRVEERDSEHRRSVQDVIAKVTEYINGQLQLILQAFEKLPSGCEEEQEGEELRTTVAEDDALNSEGLVQQLEDLVAMDLERKNVVQQFEEYDREHRAMMDMPSLQQAVWATSNSESTSTMTLTDKLPSELLLLYIITSLELREWYESWKKLRDKWLGSPLTGVHPGTMINRIKQFRRRLGHASSRLTRLSSVLLQTFPSESPEQNQLHNQEHGNEDRKTCPSFARKDFELMRVFDESIEEMLNCNRVFQAISGGAFSEARWAAMHQLLSDQSGSDGTAELTLRRMKDKCDARQIEEFLEVCDECIVEAKLHMKMEQARQRLARIEVRVEETNYSVRCDGVADALAQLDDIAVEVKLCLFGQNPELQLCLELRDELERKTTVCKHIVVYQKDWRLRCEATKLHEVDEFFSKRFGGGGDYAIPRSRRSQKVTGLKQEQTVWQAFLEASHAWSDRLRRLFFVCPHEIQTEQKGSRKISLGRKSVAPAISTPLPVRRRMSIATKSMQCTLDDVMESFEGFDFEANFTACERGMELVHTYLDSLRDKTPRLYCLDQKMMLRLLLRDSDIQQLHQSLAICFPRVHRFAVSRVPNRIGSTVETYGKQDSAPIAVARTRKNDGTIVIVGLDDFHDDVTESRQCGRFRLAVAKIGRVKFWFTRLEEEMSSMVLSDLKRALEWAPTIDDSVECGSLLLQSIATACALQFTFEMNRALRTVDIQANLRQLKHIVNERLEHLISVRRAGKDASSSLRFEIMILLSSTQSGIIRHIGELFEQGAHEDAMFFWSMQLQTRAFVETISAPGTTTQPSPSKHGRTERSELFPTSAEAMKIPVPNHSGQSITMSVYCQVAHLQLSLGREFVGCGRIASLSPFTQRCSYALFSALKMHHTALVVPYSAAPSEGDPSSLVWGVGQLLMRPCIEFSCSTSAGVTTIHHLGSLINAASRLDGFLIVRHLLQLSAALIGAVQQRMLQHFYQVTTAGSHGLHHHQQVVTNSLVLPRQHGGLSYGASAIFTPLDSDEDLHRSGLVQSIRTQFRAVAAIRPSIEYIVECFLVTEGYTIEQIKELNVVQAFKAIDTLETGRDRAFSVVLLAPRVIHEARRLREFYRVVWNSLPLRKMNDESTGHLEICEAQCIFRQAFVSTIDVVSVKEHALENQQANNLLMKVFPLAEGGKLVTKSKTDEEAVSAAVTIYFESVFALPADCKQFELVMELWRALQVFPAALICGPPGSGKSTCIMALHRALVALELSERNLENEKAGRRSSPDKPESQLVILNPQLLTLDQFYNNIAAAYGSEALRKTTGSSSLKWVLVDGEIDGAVLDRLLEGDNRACSAPSALPSSSILYRGQRSSVLSGDCIDSDLSPRVLFEVTSLVNLSPSALTKCWALHVPMDCIDVQSIIGAWRARWQNQLVFSSESRGAEALEIVFKAVDLLISSMCVNFAIDEAESDPVGEASGTVGLRLGYLSLNHITTTALKLVTTCCFQNKSLLQELSYLRLVELVAFSALWSFTGHLPDPFMHKLENYVRVKSKEYSETKHLAEQPLSLMDANCFEDVWYELQPRLSTPSTPQLINDVSPGSKPDSKMQSAFDSSSGQVLVLVPASSSLIRICTVLLHSSQSFLLVGPAASGKTALLRWIKHRNREDEIAEMKIETSLDERHVHGILDWMDMPAAWFNPLSERDSAAISRAKMREEADLFSGRAKHSFVFLDDLDASGETANMKQNEFVRTMLDHRLGYSTKQAGFQIVEKQVGAGMRLDDSAINASPTLARLIRHFTVFRVPRYSQKDLLGIFRIKYQQHFSVDVFRANTERRLSAKGVMGGGQQLPLEEVILRASVDFAVELAGFQQLRDFNHPCLFLFNLHHVNMLLERTLAFASSVFASRKGDPNERAASDGTTLVMLGKAHQSWLCQLQNLFLSNCPPESLPVKTNGSVEDKRAPQIEEDDIQKKISLLLHHLSEKYFSVAFRGSGVHHVPISVGTLHFLVKLAEHHVQAPLLQPRLAQLRQLLNEHMTAANGMSRRSSDQARGASTSDDGASSPVELVSSVLLEIAAASTSPVAMNGTGLTLYSKLNRPYSPGQLAATEMKLLLSSSWCLEQATHLIHALSEQQVVVVSSTSERRKLLSDRLLRFACDVHGFKVHLIDELHDSVEVIDEQQQNVLRTVLGAAGVRQERVALWIRQHQLVTNDCKTGSNRLAHILQEIGLGKLPSLTLLPGGEELREELLLSCIQSRKQLELVTEGELMSEFQLRLRENFRLCVIEENDEDDEQKIDSPGHGVSLLRWIKTLPSCRWRRLNFLEADLQFLIPELSQAGLTSAALCGMGEDLQQTARFAMLCQNVHGEMMSMSSVAVEPASQLNYFVSFLTNTTVAYGASLQSHQEKIKRLETALKTLAFARDKVTPTLKRMQESFELQCKNIDDELEIVSRELELENQHLVLHEDEPLEEMTLLPEQEESRWALRSCYEELMLMSSETKLRLDEVSRYLAEWNHVADRLTELFSKWTCELELEKTKTDNGILALAVDVGARRAYSHVAAFSRGKRKNCMRRLDELIDEYDVNDSRTKAMLADAHTDAADTADQSAEIAELIWVARFPFLRNREVYRDIRMIDELCDRVPVIVDPSGVLQRFLVHIFSGHTLFSTFPGCGVAGEVESENPSSSKDSMIVSCDDPKFASQLEEALRLTVPVLLVNFRSTDKELLHRLQPFLDHTRISHAPPRRPMLRELTLRYYEEQRKQKQRRTSIAGSAMAAMSSLAQTAATVGGGAVPKPRRTMKDRLASRIKTITVHEAVAASAFAGSPTGNVLGKMHDRRDPRGRNGTNSGSTPSSSCFQIYAVTASPVTLEVQHAISSQFAHFKVSVPDSELASLFQFSRIVKSQPKLVQELRAEQIGLADCWARMIQNRDQLCQRLQALKPVIDRDKSPFASRITSTTVSIQLLERYSELATQLAIEQQTELIWKSRGESVQDKNAELVQASQNFAQMATRLVGIARCMRTMSSLRIGNRMTPFYLRSVRYVEHAAAQQLAAQDDDATQLSTSSMDAILTRVGAGFISNSHEQVFRLLELLQQQIQMMNDELASSAWIDAVVWLVTSSIRKSKQNDATSIELRQASAGKCDGIGNLFGRRNSLTLSGDAGTSLVERLRRRVKLCAYLFNGWKASKGSKNVLSKQLRGQRPVLPGPNTARMSMASIDTGSAASSDCEKKEVKVETLQRKFESLLSTSETFWYEWKTARVRLQWDMESIIQCLGYQATLLTSGTDERSNAIYPNSTVLLNLEDIVSRFTPERLHSTSSNELGEWRQSFLPLLLAKTFFAACFAQELNRYLKQHGRQISKSADDSIANLDVENIVGDVSSATHETWTAWSSPPSLVVDIAPPRGKNSRVHLPRAMILYMPGERSNIEIYLSAWDIAVFIDVDADNVNQRGELTMLITTKHKFVLEILDAGHVESALTLVSQLINENALLSVPEWYLLVSFAVATEIENGKLTIMDRIVLSPETQRRVSFIDRGHGQDRSIEQTITRKLVDECGASASTSAMTLAIVQSHSGNAEEQVPATRDLEDLVLHQLSIDEMATDNAERDRMCNCLLLLLNETVDHSTPSANRTTATGDAKLSSELLCDFMSVADSSLRLFASDPTDSWEPRYCTSDGEAASQRLWNILCQVRDLFEALQAVRNLPSDQNNDPTASAQFFPWQSFDCELENQLGAFEAIQKHLRSLRTPTSSCSNRQQQLASLARGYVPFEWTETFFARTTWPSQSSGSVSTAQVVLLVACRVGVLVRCLRGDRAWALNLAVVSDACEFLRCLRAYTATRCGLADSSLMMIIELDSSVDAADTAIAMSEEERKKKTVLAATKQFQAKSGSVTRNTEWHGAVLHHIDNGIESWGIRVEGLVLIQQGSSTRLHLLPMCRITCQPRNETTSAVEVPMVILPSMSPYQPAPILPQHADTSDAVRLILGRSINSVSDIGDNSTTNETMQYGVGVPVFPDDDSNECS